MKLAVFDFDGTLFPKDTLPFLFSHWKNLKCTRFTYYKTFLSLIPLSLKYKLQIITKLSKQEIKLMAVRKSNRLFIGMTEQEVIAYFSNCVQEIKGLLNEPVVREIERAHSEGFHTVLLSGAYNHLLRDIGEYLNFDTVIGSEMCFNNNYYDADKETEVVVGDLKLKKIYERFDKDLIDWEASRSYADSYSDIDILQAVGHPVAVNPDAKLRAIAVEKGWRII